MLSFVLYSGRRLCSLSAFQQWRIVPFPHPWACFEQEYNGLVPSFQILTEKLAPCHLSLKKQRQVLKLHKCLYYCSACFAYPSGDQSWTVTPDTGDKKLQYTGKNCPKLTFGYTWANLSSSMDYYKKGFSLFPLLIIEEWYPKTNPFFITWSFLLETKISIWMFLQGNIWVMSSTPGGPSGGCRGRHFLLLQDRH